MSETSPSTSATGHAPPTATGDTPHRPAATDDALTRLRDRLHSQDLGQALLSHPESVAHLAGFSDPVEDWPVANPFLGGPALLALTPASEDLIIGDFYARHSAAARVPVRTYRSYDFERPPDPAAELERAIDEVGFDAGPIGVELGSLPTRVADALRARSHRLVAIDELVLSARRRKSAPEIAALRTAAGLADAVQQAVREHAEAGITELELAALAQASMNGDAGRRVPAVLWVTAGEGTSSGGAEPTNNRLRVGDLVLTDTSPWIDGAWSDSARAVVVGTPSREQQLAHDDVRRALELAIDLSRPGARACDIDRRVRESLAEGGDSYPHHSGHGIGAAWSEEPRIVPYNSMEIEEEMVLAMEPAVYRPGWGGIRLEDVFVVRASGNELLTVAEHRL